MELKFIIGYSPSKCLNLKWSKVPGENIVLFTSCGSLIAMDVETNQQKRFFFGHSAPICCFDVAAHGGMIASAQEGKNSIIRIWDYATARCLQMLTMPVTSMQAVSFSPDGRFLASVGKDAHNKQMIIVWDISRIHRGEKPDIFAKQTSDFNILCLKFSPVDNFRLVSCGQQNVRFWRIKETRNIRGSAVVLNQHARNTVFTTLDFEYGAHDAAVAGQLDSKDNDALKRVYVASKHGMVYQINYLTEQLEATYRTNDSDIYSIAVNEAFCVTGSADQFLRVWALDFSEFFMEAKHEGTVCAVDISADGLRVACGTLNGSLGVLNKSNQRYKTLLRSHTDSILSMDFHLAKRNVITVSSDATIRLWDMANYDQVVEFSSPIDQPLCVSAHPTLPIFSCGFKSGSMRVFDIEKTCVAATFTQFDKKPIQALAYSPAGDLLVTCCADGSVALHNARRQHLPTKMMHLEFPPQFVHVAFSGTIATRRYNVLNQNIRLNNQGAPYEDDSESYQDAANMESERESQEAEEVTISESLFGVMGEYGNNLMIYSSDSIVLKHQIPVGAIIRSFQFSKNSREVIVVTKDQRIRVYSLAGFEGLYLRELTTVHRGACRSTDLSNNGGYMLTGGEDNLLKMWDYDAQKTVPFFYQAFIGHTFPLVSAMFNPLDNGMVVSAAENDGIYIWSFYGDTKTNYHPQLDDEGEAATAVIDREELHQPTVLEKMRMAVKEKKKPKLAEYSFIVQDWKAQEQHDHNLHALGAGATDQTDLTGLKAYYTEKAAAKELNYNHFVSVKEELGIDVKLDKKEALISSASEGKTALAEIVNGYDGFGGVHDNLLWNPKTGIITYTMNNKVIMENTKTRQQTVLCDSTVRLSCLAQSPDGKMLAAAEGEPNEKGQSYIYLYDTQSRALVNTLTFHQKGVQSMAFAPGGAVLITLGVSDENALALLDVEQGIVVHTALIRSHATNKIIVDPHREGGLEFITIGAKGSFLWWKVDDAEDEGSEFDLQFHEVEMKDDLKGADFVTAAFTPMVVSPYGSAIVLLGTANGEIVAYNPKEAAWLDGGRPRQIMSGEIGQIVVRSGQVVVADSTGLLARYAIPSGKVFPPEDPDAITTINISQQPATQGSDVKARAPITALVMDELNVEGILGTAEGNLHYVNFQENPKPVTVKLVSGVSPVMEPINVIKYDGRNPRVFLTTCGLTNGDVKLYTSATVDQIVNFPQYSLGPVKFVTATGPKNRGGARIIGHEKGLLKLVDIGHLKVVGIYQLALEEGETLTCGAFNNSGHNFAIGTSFGSVFLGYHKKDSFGRYSTFLSRVNALSKTTANAVTSVQLSQFTPSGSLLCAFDNGQVRLWQSSLKNDQFTRVMEMRGLNKPQKGKKPRTDFFEIHELGPVQFDLIDKFDMFDNPHDEDKTEEELETLKELYCGEGRAHQCEAHFALGSSSVDHYFCYVSDLQYIFVRNYQLRTTMKIALTGYFPTQLCMLDYYKLATQADLPIRGGGLQALACVGTKEGKVLCYKVENQEYKLVVKTKGGLLYGPVSGLAVQEDGSRMVAASGAGELVTFKLLDNLAPAQTGMPGHP